ncbi:hypothetical protein GGR56DRAFT_670437 [Xylariaceae sp. FL0804]|nr:hypothetical protein GGR56DRAFT_670437 [Xylariaceae sp. FL0804]
MADVAGDPPIVPVPPPWKLRGTVYVATFWNRAGNLPPEVAYAPLEAASAFASPAAAGAGAHVGGLSQIQVIRYTSSPVGPYDELIVCPGSFAYAREEKEEEGRRGRRYTARNARITRIYVSQKYTCWNGRVNWNVPKHLARFEWAELPDGSTRVRVYPLEDDDDEGSGGGGGLGGGGGPPRRRRRQRPLFQAAFRPVRWAPRFPLSSAWLRFVGVDASLVQPPLPRGPGSEELPGTDRWCRVVPSQSTRRCALGWLDLSQRPPQQQDGGDDERKEEEEEVGEEEMVPGPSSASASSAVEHENFWPRLGRWQLALKLEDAEIGFGEPEYWDAPRTSL